MGLDEDFVDDVYADGFSAGAHGLKQAGEAEVTGAAQDTVGAAYDKLDGLLGKGVMPKPRFVELCEDECAHVVGIELGDDGGVGDAGLDVVVDFERHARQQIGFAEEDDIMVFWEIFEKQTHAAQHVHIQMTCLIDDDGKLFCGLNGRGCAQFTQHGSQRGLPFFESPHPSIKGFQSDFFSRGLAQCMNGRYTLRDIFKRAPQGFGIYGESGQQCGMQYAEGFSAAFGSAPSAADNTVSAIVSTGLAAFGRSVENKASDGAADRTGNLFQSVVHGGSELLFRVVKTRKRNRATVPN